MKNEALSTLMAEWPSSDSLGQLIAELSSAGALNEDYASNLAATANAEAFNSLFEGMDGNDWNLVFVEDLN